MGAGAGPGQGLQKTKPQGGLSWVRRFLSLRVGASGELEKADVF